MTVKPLATAVDVSITPTNLGTANVISVVNTSNSAVSITLAGTSSIEFWIGAGERITVEKEYAADVVCVPAQPAGTVYANKVAYTN